VKLLVTSAKHAPGATTLGLAVACALAEDLDDGPPVIIEVDPAGGDLAALLGLRAEPGLATLAAAARHGHEPGLLWRHANPLPAGGAVVLAPTDPTQSRSAAAALRPQLDELVRTEEVDSVFDLGRLSDADALGLAGSSDAILVACRPDLAGIDHTRQLVRQLAERATAAVTVVVLVGDRPYGPADVTTTMPDVLAASVPFDHAGALALVTGPAKRARRSALVRSARTMLDEVAGVLR
jgi:Flp pilus assembly CpaE family ATPase